jgi:hypothetical protein
MNIRLPLTAMCCLGLLSGCVSYSAVMPGTVSYNGLEVKTSQAWNLAPDESSPASRSESKTWTQDGILLDRILFIPGVPSGQTLFYSASDAQPLPAFRADMLPNEIEELTESSIARLFPKGEISVETSNLRPHSYAGDQGFLFDMDILLTDGPDYGGIVGGFVAGPKLYLIIFLGAKPYYYEKHRDEVLAIIRGAGVRGAAQPG